MDVTIFSSFKISGNISTQLIYIKLPATKASTKLSFSIEDIPNPINAPINALQFINPLENRA